MFKVNLDRNNKLFYVYSSTFISGLINSAALYSCATYVAHLTGITTQIGIHLAEFHWSEIVECLSLPVWFVLGAFSAGCLSPAFSKNQAWTQDEDPEHRSFGMAMALAGLCLLLVALCGQTPWPSFFPKSFLLASLLAYTSGLLNGSITRLSKGSYRSTHVTGLVTDIGLDLATLRDSKRIEDRQRLKSRFISYFMFIFGSFSGATLSLEFGFLTFTVPSLLSFILTGYALSVKQKAKEQKVLEFEPNLRAKVS